MTPYRVRDTAITACGDGSSSELIGDVHIVEKITLEPMSSVTL